MSLPLYPFLSPLDLITVYLSINHINYNRIINIGYNNYYGIPHKAQYNNLLKAQLNNMKADHCESQRKRTAAPPSREFFLT
mmetsp:Transcript_21197/g.44163  ORF Transcript_21197/g.44163 Transcript_21197/m.44163 type:complete len:81 (+) Transcript_21197:146-388(+)